MTTYLDSLSFILHWYHLLYLVVSIFFENIPRELEESAGIDGAGTFTTLLALLYH